MSADPDNPIWDDDPFVQTGHVQPVQIIPRRAPKSLLKQKQIEIDQLQATVDNTQGMLREVYRERARLVAFLASLYPCHVGHTDPNEPDWLVVMVHTSAGQMSWHIAPEDADLFEWVVEMKPGDWDGHTTEEKYRRLEELVMRIREGVEDPMMEGQ